MSPQQPAWKQEARQEAPPETQPQPQPEEKPAASDKPEPSGENQ